VISVVDWLICMFDVDFSGFCWLWTIGLILVDFGSVDDG
jgi:hypothetical protein